jgi:hypothetical protein
LHEYKDIMAKLQEDTPHPVEIGIPGGMRSFPFTI